MKKVIFTVALVAVLALATGVSAQAALRFDTVQIQFWPEYDRPEMLVIYTFELPAEQSLPVEMSVRIPESVVSPTAVAVLEGNQLVTREYTLEKKDGWTVVNFSADSPVIQLEYYDPGLNQVDSVREYGFDWSFDHPVDDLFIAFKSPINASDLVFSPDLGIPTAGADGLDFYSANLGELPAGEALSFTVEYQKTNDLLSAELLTQTQPESMVAPVATAVPENQFPAWGWAVVGAGAVVFAAGGVYLWRINNPTAPSRYRQKKARSGSVRLAVRGSVYCHQCGAQAKSSDKFCRECGTKLRK